MAPVLTPPTAGQIAGLPVKARASRPSENAESGIPVTGVAKSRFHTATHAVPGVRGSSVRPLLVTATGMPAADAADPIWHMAGRYRPPDALRRADTLPRADPPAAMTARQPG
jgi:hypothetical protein